MIVADASLLANLLIPGLDHASAESVQKIDSDWRAPRLWQYEFKNTLIKYVRVRAITEQTAENLLFHSLQIMKGAEQDAPSKDALTIATTHKISAYDAEYLAIAQQLGIPLITYDRKLVKAAPGIAFLPADFTGLP
jgi:predicted nucleic acid-binding protein